MVWNLDEVVRPVENISFAADTMPVRSKDRTVDRAVIPVARCVFGVPVEGIPGNKTRSKSGKEGGGEEKNATDQQTRGE